MPPSITAEEIEKLDKALDAHLAPTEGALWRTRCHEAAQIAGHAMALLFPDTDIAVKRVELIAFMGGAGKFVHVGWVNDPNIIEGKMPAHFAVTAGAALYDPTFWQLRNAKTPLDLPDEPYFYQPEFASAFEDDEGFRWCSEERPSGKIWVGYKLQPAPLPLHQQQRLISDTQALRQAQRVVEIFKADYSK